jgi:hypothetical protein
VKIIVLKTYTPDDTSPVASGSRMSTP